MTLDSYYLEVASAYDQIRLDRGEEIQRTIEEVRKVFAEGDRVLDIGAGTGRYAQALGATGIRVVALDKRPMLLDRAPDRIPKVSGYAQRLPFRKNVFKGCMMILVLHQIPIEQRMRTFAECFRVTKSDGLLVVKTSSPEDLARRSFAQFFPSALTINLARYGTIDQLQRFAKGTGYTLESVTPLHTSELRTAEDILKAIGGKHNSTLALLSKEEFDKGFAALRVTLKSLDHYPVEHYHTVATFRRS